MIFDSLNIHGVQLKNRIVMGSMHTGLEDHRDGYKALTAYFKERAKNDTSMIITGGYSPNLRGRLSPFSSELSSFWHLKKHKYLNSVINDFDCKMILQILHAGRYAYHPFCVAPSSIKAPISKFKPKELSSSQVKRTIKQFVKCAQLAKKAGYKGVEIMGSEGYLLNQFIAPRTNKRTDEWGGSFKNRIKLPLEIVKRIKDQFKDDLLLIFRISLMDFVEDGSSWEEVIELAKELERAGVSILNSGIGWHEARVPTIATNVPRGAFSFSSAELKKHVKVPIIAVNRFNNAKDIRECLKSNDADLVSMARPFLADPEIVRKFKEEKHHLVNTCIACNQACLDHIFENKDASCLVNPKACDELRYTNKKVIKKKKVLVIGGGPAGLSCAKTAAELGHDVTLKEAGSEIGGQFNLAKKIPGKDEFYETLRYFHESLKVEKVSVELNSKVDISDDLSVYDEVVIATGVYPRVPKITGIEHPKVVLYKDLIEKKLELGQNVAIIGAGGIGFDIASYLLEGDGDFYQKWNIDKTFSQRGAISRDKKEIIAKRNIFLLKRSEGKFGKTLGKTTGWIKRQKLKKNKVKMIAGVKYSKIDNEGLHIILNEKVEVLKVDHIVICAGQISREEFKNNQYHVIGGAKFAGELDAKRAIKEGHDLAYSF